MKNGYPTNARVAARDTFAVDAYVAAKINFSKLAKQAIKLAKME